jgi:hypothetical protein
MLVGNIQSSAKEYKYFPRKAGHISKVQLRNEPRLFITLGTRGRGGRGLGRFHEITEMFVDQDNRKFAGFKTTDRSGHSYQYAIIGRLLSSEAAVEDK